MIWEDLLRQASLLETGELMRQPVHEIRYGLIKARIWLNETKSGDRHNVTVVRLYRIGDHWKESTIFGRDDLPLACKALDQAHTWIFEHIQQEREAAQSDLANDGQASAR